MGKNTNGGNKSRKCKNNRVPRAIPVKDDVSQEYAIITSNLGNGACALTLIKADGSTEEVRGHIRGLLRKRRFLKGEFVLVSYRDFEKVKPNELRNVDILFKYDQDNVADLGINMINLEQHNSNIMFSSNYDDEDEAEAEAETGLAKGSKDDIFGSDSDADSLNKSESDDDQMIKKPINHSNTKVVSKSVSGSEAESEDEAGSDAEDKAESGSESESDSDKPKNRKLTQKDQKKLETIKRGNKKKAEVKMHRALKKEVQVQDECFNIDDI